jgi:pyruvate-formate lyase-activating enzyme
MYADRDPSIAGMVIDSAMTDLKTLAEELCKRYVSVPSFVLSAAMALVKKSVSMIFKYNSTLR